jgi:uncharacterized membrane protein YagU involved in acid resistance
MDRLVGGAATGLGAGLAIGFISNVLYILNVCKLCLVAIGGGFARQRMLGEAEGFAWFVLGWVDHLRISMLFGIILAYVLHYTGLNYVLLKGAFFGAVLWLLGIAMISPLAGYIPPSPSPLDLSIMLAYHIIYGLLVSRILIRFTKTEPVVPE